MFGLSSSSSYAVLALSSLSGAGDSWILARDLAAAIDAPLPYLSKILHGLAGAGIVEAKRGYRGPIYTPRATASLSKIMLEDSARLAAGDVE